MTQTYRLLLSRLLFPLCLVSLGFAAAVAGNHDYPWIILVLLPYFILIGCISDAGK